VWHCQLVGSRTTRILIRVFVKQKFAPFHHHCGYGWSKDHGRQSERGRRSLGCRRKLTATVDDTCYKRIQTDELWFGSHIIAAGASEINFLDALRYLNIHDRTQASERLSTSLSDRCSASITQSWHSCRGSLSPTLLYRMGMQHQSEQGSPQPPRRNFGRVDGMIESSSSSHT